MTDLKLINVNVSLRIFCVVSVRHTIMLHFQICRYFEGFKSVGVVKKVSPFFRIGSLLEEKQFPSQFGYFSNHINYYKLCSPTGPHLHFKLTRL